MGKEKRQSSITFMDRPNVQTSANIPLDIEGVMLKMHQSTQREF